MIFVSSCLMGEKCRYDGKSKPCRKVIDYVKDKEILKVCPECLGDLAIPRIPSEIVGGDGLDVIEGKVKVLNKDWDDVTRNFLDGARRVVELAEQFKPNLIIFKEKSPSCGRRKINDGSFTGKIVPGCGVTTALLKKNGFGVITEEDVD